MDGIVVRRAGASEADRRRLARLRRRWAEEDAGGPIDDDGYEARAAAWLVAHESDRLVWLAESDGQGVGFVTAVPVERMPQPGRVDSGFGYLHHFFVVAERRGGGVGRALLDAVVDEAARLGWERLLLHTRPRSRPFYERAGFVDADGWLVLAIDRYRR